MNKRFMVIIAAVVIIISGLLFSGNDPLQYFRSGDASAGGCPIVINRDKLEIAVNDMIAMLELTKVEVKIMAAESADKNIFNHAISSTQWFTDRYYSKRDDPEVLMDGFNRYIIKPEYIEFFILNLADIIDRKLKEVTAGCIAKAAGIDTASVRLEYKGGTLYEYIKSRVPGTEAMNKTLCDEIIKKIAPQKRDEFIKKYEELREKHPQYDACAEAFIIACAFLGISNIDEHINKVPDVLIPMIPAEHIGDNPDTINSIKYGIQVFIKILKEELAYVGGKMKFKDVIDRSLRNFRQLFIDCSEKCVVNIINKVILQVPQIYESGNITIDLKGGSL